MSDGYLFKPESTFLNALVFGSDAGYFAVAPELRQIIAQNRTLDAVRKLGDLQMASLYGQRIGHDSQRESNERLDELHSGVEQVGREMTNGLHDVSMGIGKVGAKLGDLTGEVREGLGEVGTRIGTLNDDVNQGFDTVQQLQIASLYGQQIGHELQRETNERLDVLHGGVRQMGQELSGGLRDVSAGVREVAAGIGELSGEVQQGFEQLGLGMRTGF